MRSVFARIDGIDRIAASKVIAGLLVTTNGSTTLVPKIQISHQEAIILSTIKVHHVQFKLLMWFVINHLP